MRKLMVLALFMMSLSSIGQNYKLALWPDGVPNAKTSELKEYSDSSRIVRISHVQNPIIEVFLPSKRNATGQAMIICPGGGYQYLAYDWEGTDVAKYLNAHGIAGIVLRYRLPDDDSNVLPHKSPLMDAQQAMRTVRKNAEKWSIESNKIGIMGFSAGGHLASTLGTHFDQESRPDFMALIYPVISMDDEITHHGSRTNLLGKQESPELLDYYSNEKQIKNDTPPTFLVHSTDDRSVPVENSLVFYKGLIEKDISAEMHIYPSGGHGYGLASEHEYLSTWPERLIDWLEGLE